MTVGIQQDVVRFNVAMDISQTMHGVDGQHHFHDVELGHVLRQSVFKLAQQRQEVSTAVVVHDKIQIGLVLESEMKVGNPSPITENEDVSFFLKAGRFGPLQHLPFVKDFKSVDAIGVAQFDDADLAERTSADHFQDLEVIFAQPQGFDAICYRFNCK